MEKYGFLIDEAKKASESSYSPYSNFSVGAALLCEDGSVYTGCNIENASYSPTCCAERVAIFKAVSEGKRAFKAIAVFGKGKDAEPELCYPCGVCRQVLAEFCGEELDIVLCDPKRIISVKLGELLPNAFKL